MPLSNIERQHRFQDNHASIDAELDAALEAVDWKRREKGTASLVDFVQTYCIGSMIDDSPSAKYIDALREMESALAQSRPYNIELPRGSGKTSAAEMAVLWLVASGLRKFAVIVSANHVQAQNIIKDIFRPIVEQGTAFAQDFPEVCIPFQQSGSFRRRQLYRGQATAIQKTASQITLARLTKGDGTDFAMSQSTIVCRGITSGVRGLKQGTLRPDLVLLDDLQTAESAASPEQVKKLRDIINKDILNLSSKGKLSVIMTSTPICPEDLCSKIEADKNWRTTKYPAIVRWPRDVADNPDGGLWSRYYRIFDRENAENKPHDESRQFYLDNREQMDEGAELFAPNRYKPEEHESGLQALMDKRHLIGDSAFAAEMQMQPKRFSFALNITPHDVIKKACEIEPLQIPDGFVFVAASTDLNLSYALTTVLIGFRPDGTAHLIWHQITPCRIDSRLPEAEYSNAVIRALTALGKQLRAFGIKIDGWGIDASGTPFEAVTAFCKSSVRLCGISACAMTGRASHIFTPFFRSRLRDEIKKTVLCGDAQEHVKAGAGKKWMVWDSDHYRELAQKAILAAHGASGGLTLYKGDSEEHVDFANQICNERLIMIQHKPDGHDVYTWRTREPHDYLDATAQAFAVAASQNIGGTDNLKATGARPNRNAALRGILRKRPKVRIV